MRVRVDRAFAVGHRAFNPGEEVDLPDETAIALLRDGTVERVAAPVPETAVLKGGEQAVRVARPVR